MNNEVYFGTKERMRWVKAPAVNTPLSKAGWSNVGTDLNGGGYAKLSPTAHKEYEFTWGASPAQDIYDILDYRSGAYGLGPLYYLDPFAMQTNILSAAFSMPRTLAEIGKLGGSFTVNTEPLRVSFSGAESPSFYVPIPSGFTLWVTYRASANVLYRGNTAIPATPLANTTSTWTSFSSSELSLRWQGTGVAFGAMARVLPNGTSPATTLQSNWVPGRGSTGLKFAGEPTVTGLSAVYGDNGGLLNASARLIETELWDN